MPDEFDELPTTVPAHAAGGVPAGANGPHPPIAELVAQVYRGARPPLRKRLLECLLRPVGPLGLVAIAAGAFGAILQRGGYRELAVTPEDASRISPEQMLELARYVEQANPESLLQIAPIVSDQAAHMAGMAGIAASLLLVALQAWRQRAKGG
jgi:hypothetical protein